MQEIRGQPQKPEQHAQDNSDDVVFEQHEAGKPQIEEHLISQPDQRQAAEEIEQELAKDDVKTQLGAGRIYPESNRKKKKWVSLPGALADTLVRPLRTYKEDVAAVMKTRRSSVTSIVAAEQNRRAQRKAAQAQETPPQKRRSWFLITGSVVFLVLGAVFLFSILFFLNTDGQPKTPQKPIGLIFTDDEMEVAVGNLDPDALKSVLNETKERVSLSLGEIAELYITQTSEAKGLQFLTVQDLFNRLDVQTPDSLLRSVDKQFMLGVHAFDGNQPFLLLRVNSFENAFAGMLAWEFAISKDLAPFFGVAIPPQRTSTSTPPQPVPFTDRVIRNLDTRVLLNKNGEIALLYVFPSRGTLIITTNEHTMAEVLIRMTSTRSPR